MKPNSVAGKVVWITGASSGLGAALAVEMARRGAVLILSGRNEKALAQVAAQCTPSETKLLPFDLSVSAERLKAAQKALEFYKRVDYLFLNAGVSQRVNFLDTSPDVFGRIMETNFMASADLARACLPSMITSRSGGIIVISSLAGLMGAPLRTAYSASKHALCGLFGSLRTEVAAQGVQITLVYPGFMRTAISENALEGNGSPHAKLDPLQKFGQDPAVSARKIVEGVFAKKYEIKVAFDLKARLGLFLSRHFTSLFVKSITRHGGI